MDKVAIQLQHSSVSVFFGATNSGKSRLCFRLMQHANQIYEKPVDKFLYCYSVYQPLFDEIQDTAPGVTFHWGIPDAQVLEKFADTEDGHYVVLLDDLQSSVLDSKEVVDLCTVKCHHMNFSCWILLQNLYGGGRFSRTIALQSQYMFALRSPRDVTQLAHLSRQLYGAGKSAIIPAIMKYPRQRLRTSIFPGELTQIFVPKS